MRIVLLSTPTRTYTPNYIIPVGILSLAAYLEQLGHEVHVVDAAALREPNNVIVSRVMKLHPQLIGIGGIITAYDYISKLSLELKKALPNVPIVLGGQVVINNTENCFKYMSIDYIVHGYGEIALEKLVRYLNGSLSIAEIPGISYSINGIITVNHGRDFFEDINDLPLPAYHLIDMEYYATVNGQKLAKLQKYLDKTGKTTKNHRFMTIMGTLGCTDRCTFCVHEQEYVGHKIFSNDYLIRHIKHVHKTYDIHIFAIGEEMFITTLNRAKQFNSLMKTHLPEIYWSASTRANYVTTELVAELETGNCFQLAWGFESGSQKMLDLMKKRITREQNISTYTIIDKSKLVPACSLMIGNVGETNDSIKETLDGIKKSGIGRSAVFFASPYPGSRIWDWAIEREIIKDSHQYLLAASDRDAASRINVNLTPFPNFVLKAWQQIVMWACEKEERRKRFRLHAHAALMEKIRRNIRSLIGHTYIPTPLLQVVIDIYFLYYNLSRKLYKTKKDRQYQYNIDNKGGLLPAHLIVGKPQIHMPPNRINHMISSQKKDDSI